MVSRGASPGWRGLLKGRPRRCPPPVSSAAHTWSNSRTYQGRCGDREHPAVASPRGEPKTDGNPAPQQSVALLPIGSSADHRWDARRPCWTEYAVGIVSSIHRGPGIFHRFGADAVRGSLARSMEAHCRGPPSSIANALEQ
jgi:hypothetical protein